MVPDKFAALIDECVAEVERTSGSSRPFKPPANPMLAKSSERGSRRRAPDLSYLELPRGDAGTARRSRRTKLATVSVGSVLLISAVGWLAGSSARQPPASLAPPPARASVLTPASAVVTSLRRGESCHQIERDLMTTFRHQDGTPYSQSEADALLTSDGASC